jgi:hypothetical protein
VIGREKERVEKDPSLVDSSTGIRFLVNQTLVKQITRVTCVYSSSELSYPTRCIL